MCAGERPPLPPMCNSPHSDDGETSCHILQWVEECISSKTTGPLKDASMDAPDDAVLHLAQLALSCTVECPTSRPSMSGIANELQGIRHEVVGKEVLSATVKVDEEAEEIGIGMSFWGNLNTDLEAIETMDEEESNGEQSAKSIQ
ncbi:unnamed protein product [Closterium sp. NIES-65]|nr:unnamed protein product [Closterium sp. NIES-65]